jgi:uncharacterized protein YcbK (DUF882 family)
MLLKYLSRRSFLKASLLGSLTVIGNRSAYAKILSDEVHEGRLKLFNTHNKERLDILYRNSLGEYDAEALKELNRIFRCHYTQKVTEMDIRTIEFLNNVDKKLGGGHEIHIICGYRSPEYNSLLRQRTRSVAKHSLHMQGQAVDISIPGASLAEVRRVAVAMKSGGVGYYPGGGFVHLDSGSFRTW